VASRLQDSVYCARCTEAFRHALDSGSGYRCARCAGPVPLQDIRAGVVIYFEGQLREDEAQGVNGGLGDFTALWVVVGLISAAFAYFGFFSEGAAFASKKSNR
jgi:DNA-directed RNA polymerase subunit RPC12/RpoP